VLNAAPVAASALSTPLKFPEAPAFTQMEDGKYEARCARYHASLSAAEGLKFQPLSKSNNQRPGSLGVRLRSVTREKLVVFDRDTDPEATTEDAVEDDSGSISFWRTPGFEERYKPRGDGVEQVFAFDAALGGSGDLKFVCDVTAKDLIAQPPRPNRAGGISFMHADGTVGARYGQVVVRDSAQHGISIEPRLSADGTSIAFAVPAAWLETAMFPIEVDPLVGADFVVSASGADSILGGPAVCAGTNNFLVVWDDITNAGAPQLNGAIITSTGIVSSPLVISAATGFPQPYQFQRIEVAYDGTANWLVVYSDYRQVGPGIRGAIISNTGTLLGGSDFLIASTSGLTQEFPLCEFNGSDFVVAWTTTPVNQTSGSQINYTRVTTSGVVATSVSLPSLSSPANQALLFLAGQKPSGDTLLIYRELTETPVVTRSVRIGNDGTVRDPGGTSLFKDRAVDGGFGRAIGATFVGGVWQILSSYDQTLDSSIFMHQLSTDGVVTPPTGVFAVVGEGPTGTNSDQYPPAFAGPSGWLFLRNEKVNAKVYHILGKRVGFDGIDQDPIPFQVDTSTQGILRSAVASQAGNLFLVGWLDGRLAPVQPGDAHDIAAALVDVTVTGSPGPALVPVISASPTSGTSPLAVNFDSAGSTGAFDTLQWDFGDGTTSTAASVSHTYKINGTFTAQLKLTKGAYSVQQTITITVGTGPGNSGGATQIGIPVDNTTGIVPSLFLNSITANLDFSTTNNDAVRVGGFIDVSALPASLTGLAGSVTIGTVQHLFTLDAKGNFKSDAAVTPFVQFSISPSAGQFVFQVTKDDLRANFDSLGAKNQTVRPAVIVPVPVTVVVGPFSATATQGIAYRATQDKNGVGTYGYLGDGREISGSFIITKFSASEQVQGKNGLLGHTYSIKGQISRPNGGAFLASETGQFTFKIGNYIVSVPSGQFRGIKGNLKYTGRVGISGLKKFSIDFTSGIFNLQLLKVPAIVAGGSDLPRTGVGITDVDLNLSFQFDLKDIHIDAGRYIFITRKSARAKNWKLRN
jgi:PKD repeat protein